MDNNDSSTEQRTPAEKKKPYEKPSFRHEQVFVTTALSCGKIDGTETSCHHNHKAS
jgi:hypothetical protein